MKKNLTILVLLLALLLPQPIRAMDLEDITEPGTYEVTLSYTDPDGQVYIKVIILTITKDDIDDKIDDKTDDDDDPKPDEEKDDKVIIDDIIEDGGKVTKIVKLTEKIEAKNFSTKPGIVKTMTDDDLIRAAHVRAYNIETKEDVPIAKVTVELIQDTQYRITFTTKKGTQASVKAYETETQEMVTWTEKNKTTSPSNSVDEFRSFNGFTLAKNIILLMIIPVGLIAILFVYANKRIADTQKTLYKKEEETDKKDTE